MLKIQFTVAAFFALTAFALSGCETTSKDMTASGREPASAKAEVLVSAESLSYARTRAIRSSVFNSVVASYSLVKSREDFNDLFLTHYSSSDRDAVSISLSKVKKWPTIEVADQALVAKLGKEKIVIEWPDVTRSEFKVNGVKWTYNPGKPYVPQLRLLMQKVDLQKRSAAAMLFLPEAHAFIQFAIPALPAAFKLIAGTVVVTAITNKLIDNFGSAVVDNIGEGYCWGLDKAGGVGVLTMCSAWKERQLGKEFAGMPALSSLALEEAEGKAGTILGNWETKDAKLCPTNNDGKDRYYQTLIRRIEYKDGVVSGHGEWARVRAVFGADRKPKMIILAPLDVDPANALRTPETANRIYAKVNFEKTSNRMTGIEIPNADWDKEKKGPLNNPTVTVGPGMDLTPKQAEILARAKQLTAFIDKKVTQCVVKEAEEDIEKGVEPLKPTGDAAPKESAPAAKTVK